MADAKIETVNQTIGFDNFGIKSQATIETGKDGRPKALDVDMTGIAGPYNAHIHVSGTIKPDGVFRDVKGEAEISGGTRASLKLYDVCNVAGPTGEMTSTIGGVTNKQVITESQSSFLQKQFGCTPNKF